MDITSVQYMEEDNNVVSIKAMINGKRWFVPIDTSNRHYAEIMRQVEAGTLTIADAD